MRKLIIISNIIFIVAIITLIACESKPSPADIMRQHASEVKEMADLANQLAKDWERGLKLVQTGEERVKSAEKKIKSAENDLMKGKEELDLGNKEISEGNRIMQESERRFRENFPGRQIEDGNSVTTPSDKPEI
ncbi:MAG: hypothetical protein JW902_16350 [Syntrophaceae bacterium]|nr:hypothetical protein [Syntrophaceae bacterium]